jgi:hypothetical protein
MVEFMQPGTKKKSQLYCETLKKSALGHSEQKTWNANIQYSTPHKNARPHTAARTRALLEHFNWELFDRPLYCPDFFPSDYHLKNWFISQRCNNNEELMEGVKT